MNVSPDGVGRRERLAAAWRWRPRPWCPLNDRLRRALYWVPWTVSMTAYVWARATGAWFPMVVQLTATAGWITGWTVSWRRGRRDVDCMCRRCLHEVLFVRFRPWFPDPVGDAVTAGARRCAGRGHRDPVGRVVLVEFREPCTWRGGPSIDAFDTWKDLVAAPGGTPEEELSRLGRLLSVPLVLDPREGRALTAACAPYTDVWCSRPLAPLVAETAMQWRDNGIELAVELAEVSAGTDT